MLGALIGMQAAGNLIGAIGQYEQSGKEAKALRRQADELARRAEKNIVNRSILGQAERGEIEQRISSSGLKTGASSLSLLNASLTQQARDIENIAEEANWEADNLYSQADTILSGRKWQLAGSLLGAGAQGTETYYRYKKGM